MTAIDVVLPVHEKDRDVLPLSLRGTLKHVRPVRRICVVSRRPVHWPDERVVWIPEPTDGQLPTLDQLRALWSSRYPAMLHRASWVYQQLLKLGAGSYIEDLSPSYLVVDADVLFLRDVSFSLPAGVRFPYSRATESWAPYHDAYRRLLGVDATSTHSMVTHHMLFDRALIAELQGEIEARHQSRWHEAYLVVLDYSCLSPISVFNTYGWWMLDRHPELSRHRQLLWRDVPVVPTALARASLARRFDFVAAHLWMRQPRWRHYLEVVAGIANDLRVRGRLARLFPR